MNGSGDACGGEVSRMRLNRPSRQRSQDNTDGVAGRVGPRNSAAGPSVTKGPLGASFAAGGCAHGESQSAGSESLAIVVRNHQPSRLWFDGGAAFVEEFGQETRDIRRGGVCTAPGSAELSPIGAVPVPILRIGIAAA